MQSKSNLYAVVQQVTTNTTSWIGSQAGDSKDIRRGQTFMSPSEGELDSIEVFSSIVIRSGKVNINLHEFDPVTKNWGRKLSETAVEFNKTDSNKWMSFSLPGIHLNKGQWYGFLLQSPSSLIGVGEAAGTPGQPPNGEGQEWKFSSDDNKGQAFTYFSLAFKVELRA